MEKRGRAFVCDVKPSARFSVRKKEDAINAAIINKLSRAGCVVTAGKKLSGLSSFSIGGPADFFIEIPDEKALSLFLQTAFGQKLRFFVVGGGTNVLFSDKGYRGAVIKLTGAFKNLSINAESVSCGAAVSLPLLVKKTASEGLSGLECCAGIPGTAGAAVCGNAGSARSWIGDCFIRAEVFSKQGVKSIIEKENAEFAYRTSALKDFIITKTNFFLKKAAGNDILRSISDSLGKRAASQPLSAANAGCIFKNPPGLSAGKLIDEAGLKGRKNGGARVSDIHANFIINAGGASAEDVIGLICFVKKAVKDKFNIDLETEIKIIGE